MGNAAQAGQDKVFQRATEWVARLDAADCSAQESDAFEDWLAADPAHVRAWIQADTLHQQAALLADDAWLRASTARVAPARVRPVWPRVAIAASLCLAVGLGWMGATDGNPTVHHHANATGLPQQQRLQDGSIVTLDAGSAVTSRSGWRWRTVELQRGRIQLQVAAASTPLRVLAGNSSIRDIGTTFQVERADDGRIEVALLEGEVEVSSRGPQAARRTLLPGQQLQVLASGKIAPGPAVSRPAAEGWLRGELVFDATPLQTVVARMNRYGSTALLIHDPALASLAVSGRFHAGDADALLSALQQGWSISARPQADGALELHRAR